jgi:hypothetical protein
VAQAMKEVEMLNLLRHPNIIGYKEYFSGFGAKPAVHNPNVK